MKSASAQSQERSSEKIGAHGFTLIELVISSALMALILTSGYLCLNAALSSQKTIQPRAEVFQKARVAMALISADLRSACPLSKDFEFLGMQRMIDDVEADNLDFATHNYKPRREREADYCQMSYYVEKELETGDVALYRRRNPTIALDPLAGGSRELITRGLRGVRFEYYDGFEWYDNWGENNPDKKERKAAKSSVAATNLFGMPEAVRVTLQFNPNPRSRAKSQFVSSGDKSQEAKSEEPPMVFQTIVRLNLAAASQNGFARAGGAESSSDSGQMPSTGQAQPPFQ